MEAYDRKPRNRSKRNKIVKLNLHEISGVDKPAQAGAQVVLIKRAGDDDGNTPASNPPRDVQAIAKGMFANALKITQAQHGDTPAGKVLAVLNESGWALREAIEAVVLVSADEDTMRVRVSAIIAEYLAKLDEILPQVSSLLSKGGSQMNADKAGEALLAALQKHTGDDGKVDADKVVDDVSKLLADAGDAKRIAELEKMVAMPQAHRDYLANVKASGDFTDEQKEELLKQFLADETTDAQRDKVVKAALDTDEVYKSQDGQVFRKSQLGSEVYGIVVAQAKQADDLRKRLGKVEADKANEAAIAKSREEFPNLPGDDSTHLALHKAFAGMGEEEADKLRAVLKSKSATNGNWFNELGSGDDTGGDVHKSATDSEAKLNKIADEIVRKSAEQGETITHATAFVRATETPEGKELYEQHRQAQH